MRPVTAPNVVYSAHMYNPGLFTHNRVWDKQQIERNLAPVIDFQKTYGVQIYVGEFGAQRSKEQTAGEKMRRDWFIKNVRS